MIAHRSIAWIACLALLMAALAPSVSRAMPARGALAGSDLILEICTEAGMKRLVVEGRRPDRAGAATDPDGPEAPAPVAGMDCPYCALPLDRVLPQAWHEAVLPVQVLSAPPAARPGAPDHSVLWLSAQSRGPPALL